MADLKISELDAALAASETMEFPVNSGGLSEKVTAAQLKTLINTAPAFPAGSASAGSWPKLAAGGLLTTPEAGAIERDSNCFYGTTDAGNRGIIPVKHIIRADAVRNFANVGTSQVIFNSPTNGRLTLETGTYLFEGLLYITAMSATSGNALINMLGAGTATISAWLWEAIGNDLAAGTVGTPGRMTSITSSSPASIVTASTQTAMGVRVKGTFEVTAAGTLIPSLTLVTASAAILAIGSYLTFERIGSTSVVSVGQWD